MYRAPQPGVFPSVWLRRKLCSKHLLFPAVGGMLEFVDGTAVIRPASVSRAVEIARSIQNHARERGGSVALPNAESVEHDFFPAAGRAPELECCGLSGAVEVPSIIHDYARDGLPLVAVFRPKPVNGELLPASRVMRELKA